MRVSVLGVRLPHVALRSYRCSRHARAQRRHHARSVAGQTLVIFALTMVVLFGALGLVLDGGYNFIQRRAMQNTADSAALTGAQAIAQNMTDTQVTLSVQDAATRNGADPTKVTCRFITNAYPGGTIEPCSSTGRTMSTLTTAFTGVLVSVAERHKTFALPVLGIQNSGTGATAAAQVQVPTGVAVGPFVVCGIDTVTVSAPPSFNNGIFKTNGTFPVTTPSGFNRTDGYENCDGGLCKKALETPDGPAINPDAYYYKNGGLEEIKYGSWNGPEFLLHDSNGIRKCNNKPAQFKGINLNAGPITLTNGTWSPPDTTKPVITNGNVTSVQATLAGVNGCQQNAQGTIDKCIMILPIVDNSGPGGTGNSALLAVRTFGSFYIRQTATGTHTGRLIKSYTIASESDPNYTPGANTPTTIRLIK